VTQAWVRGRCCKLFPTWHRKLSTGFLRLPESPGIVFVKFPGPEKSWKMSFVLENPGIVFVKFPGPGKSWKMRLVLESPEIC